MTLQYKNSPSAGDTTERLMIRVSDDTSPPIMLMCGKVTNDNLIDSSHYFRNTDQYEKLMWGFSYISFCLSKHFGESDVFVSFLLTASL